MISCDKCGFGHRTFEEKNACKSWAEMVQEEKMSDAVKDKICAEIQEIMQTYRDQDASPSGVDTPGGLEHMGDVWRLLRRWDAELGLTQKDYFDSKLPPTE